jgi:predicted secreted Zn-dependent protease
LKNPDKKEQFQQLLKTTLLKNETQSVKEEWDRFKSGIIERPEEVYGQESGSRMYKETPWWTEEIK